MAKEIILKWGLEYIKRGWSIIPVQPREKKPLIDWKEYQQRLSTETELRNWLEKWPNMNLGIVTGAISSLAVVDLDGIEGLKNGKILSVACPTIVKTGNGKHLYYKWKKGICNSASKIADSADVRGEGGCVVAPPSIHPSGRMYRWERFVPALIPDFPMVLLAATYTESKAVSEVVKSEDWLSEALEEMKNGHVHNTLVSVLGKFRAHNFSEYDTIKLLKPHALVGGEPFEGLEAKVHEIWGRYEPNMQRAHGEGILQSGIQQYATQLSIKSPTNDNDFEQFRRSNNATVRPEGLLTLFPTLDRYLEGGLKSERLFTVAARTGTGKTNFAIALARNLCEQGKKVLFFSTEFQYGKIWARYIATLPESSAFRNHAFYVCDSFSPRIEQVEEALKQVMPDVFIFDHANHLGEEKELLTQFMAGCNFLQRKYGCQGVMIAQLNRQADWVENGKRVEPRMSMIKSSGSIEQMSSRVLLLSEMRVTPEYNEVQAVLAKNDSGDRGMFMLALYKNPYRFGEL